MICPKNILFCNAFFKHTTFLHGFSHIFDFCSKKWLLATFYKVCWTCVSENTAKHTQKATLWNGNTITPMVFQQFWATLQKNQWFVNNFERKLNKTNGFSTFLSEHTIKPMFFFHFFTFFAFSHKDFRWIFNQASQASQAKPSKPSKPSQAKQAKPSQASQASHAKPSQAKPSQFQKYHK